MGNQDIPLHEKYEVIKFSQICENGIVDNRDGTRSITFFPEDRTYRKVFVISPATDPAALAALELYSRMCYPKLREELKGWLKGIQMQGVKLSRTGQLNLPMAMKHLLDTVLSMRGE